MLIGLVNNGFHFLVIHSTVARTTANSDHHEQPLSSVVLTLLPRSIRRSIEKLRLKQDEQRLLERQRYSSADHPAYVQRHWYRWANWWQRQHASLCGAGLLSWHDDKRWVIKWPLSSAVCFSDFLGPSASLTLPRSLGTRGCTGHRWPPSSLTGPADVMGVLRFIFVRRSRRCEFISPLFHWPQWYPHFHLVRLSPNGSVFIPVFADVWGLG